MPAISASSVGNTNIFTLTVRSADPQLAYDVLNCVIEKYPDVAEFVIGSTQLTMIDESGVPTQPYNRPSYLRSALIGAMAGVGENAAVALAKAREGVTEFVSVDDFQAKTGASSAVITALKEIGAFGDLPETAQISFFGF